MRCWQIFCKNSRHHNLPEQSSHKHHNYLSQINKSVHDRIPLNFASICFRDSSICRGKWMFLFFCTSTVFDTKIHNLFPAQTIWFSFWASVFCYCFDLISCLFLFHILFLFDPANWDSFCLCYLYVFDSVFSLINWDVFSRCFLGCSPHGLRCINVRAELLKNK